jgi:hypothetical protein
MVTESTHSLAAIVEKFGPLLGEALQKDTSAEAREVETLPEAQIPDHLVRLVLGTR